MKQKFGILLSLGALLILVGAGCATSKAPAVENINKPESTENQSVNNPKTDTENQLESEDENESIIKDDDAATVKPNSPTPASADTAKTMLTTAEVAKHNSQTDCYIVVRDSVYDVTKFIPNHPGGPQRIIPLCGTDATAAFTGQHDGQPQPEAALASMKIGALQK